MVENCRNARVNQKSGRINQKSGRKLQKWQNKLEKWWNKFEKLQKNVRYCKLLACIICILIFIVTNVVLYEYM